MEMPWAKAADFYMIMNLSFLALRLSLLLRDGEEVALTKDMYIDKKEILAKNAGFDTYEVSAIEDVLLESVYGSTTIALNDLRPVEKVEVAIVVKFLPSKLVYLKEEDDITLSDIFW